ncbi:MAG: hypothetical protein K6G40_01270 [Eubacterium sp.]|nr:hypothetical protein [Eubacterium sp.]
MKKKITETVVCLLFVGVLTLSSAYCTVYGTYGIGTDYSLEYAGVPGDTVLATVDGYNLTAELYAYWLTYYDQMVYAAYDGEEADVTWDMTYDQTLGITLEQYVKSAAMQTAASFLLIEKKAEDYDVTLTEDQIAELNSWEKEQVEEYGQSGFYTQLKESSSSAALMVYMNTVNMLYENLATELLGEDADTSSDEMNEYLQQWMSESDAEITDEYTDYDIVLFYDNLIPALSSIDPDTYK